MNTFKKWTGNSYNKIVYISLLVFILGIIISPYNVSAEEVAEVDVSVFKETYIVSFAPDYSPYSYVDSDGNPQGMVIEMIKYIADIAEIELYFVDNDSDYDPEYIDINLSMLAADAMDEVSIESVSYFEFPLIVIGDEVWSSSSGSVIGCLDYITLSRDDVFKAVGQNGLRTYHNYDELEDAYNSGEIDYIVVSSIVSSVLDLNGVNHIESVSLNLNLESIFTFNNNMSQVEINEFNKIIDSIDATNIYHLLVESAMNISSTEEMSLLNYINEYKREIVSTIVIFALLWLLTIYYFKEKALLVSINKDKLTNLSTERKFIEDVEHILNKKKNNELYRIIAFDIDNFKYINSSFGMEIGTEVIKMLAKNTEILFEEEIVCFSHSFADKFLMLTKAEHGIQESDFSTYIESMNESMQDVLGHEYKVHMSVGIYNIDNDDLSVRYMIDCANLARGQGKDFYENTVTVFTKEFEGQLKSEQNVVFSMENALDKNEFKMVYQPKISFETAEIVGAEALVRWMKPDGSQIFPDSFIPVMEKNGFIVSLDYYVLDSVCSFIKGHEFLPVVSVNFSGYTIIKEHFVNTVISIVENHNIDPGRIEIEITESAIVESFDLVIEDIHRLKEYGFVVSMDDFGTGVSSLNRLMGIDIDILKIDKTFVNDTLMVARGRIIMESIITMSKSLGIKTVAEGVETKEQVEILKDLECDIAQGYFYARPLTQEQFLKFIKNYKIEE